MIYAGATRDGLAGANPNGIIIRYQPLLPIRSCLNSRVSATIRTLKGECSADVPTGVDDRSSRNTNASHHL